jgi:hypothetical protein
MDLTCARCKASKPTQAFTPRPSRKRGYHSFCKPCVAAATKVSAAQDREAYLARRKASYAARAARERPKAIDRYHANRDAHMASTAAWKRENPDKIRVYNRERKARKARATPLWADKTAMRVLYEEAVKLSVETGIEHHVDHVVPLRSKLVCGLHVETNMRVITKALNVSKRNRLDPAIAGWAP